MSAISVVRYLKDRVTVSAGGAHPEKIIDICCENNISIWKIKRVENRIYFSVSRSDFKRLRAPLRRSGIRLHIVKKHGIIYFAQKNKNKVSALIGAVVFLALLWFLSGRIWVIEVIGNQSFSSGEIISLVEDFGVRTGMKRTGINSAYLKNRVLAKTDRLGFISFNVIGSRLEIEVDEIEKPQTSKKAPCNLVASEDGVVKSIKIYDGTPIVKVGDGVKKGDLLISGVRKRVDGVENFVCANGEIICTVEKTVTESTPLSFTENRRDNRYITKNTLNFFGISVPLNLGLDKGQYETETKVNTLTLGGVSLPISITENRYFKVQPTVVNLTSESAKQLLQDRATDRYIQSGKVISTKDDFYESNGVCVLKRTVTMEINAVKSQPINIVEN